MSRRVFSQSFKDEAVKLVSEHGRSVAQATVELGISESALRRWMSAAEIDAGKSPGLTSAEKAELRELKRELAIVRMERDILKKSVAFFAKESR